MNHPPMSNCVIIVGTSIVLLFVVVYPILFAFLKADAPPHKEPKILETTREINQYADFQRINQSCFIENKKFDEMGDCIAYLKNNKSDYLFPYNQTSPPLIFHVYWRGDTITQKLAVVMKSFLFTQPLDRSHMIIWLADFDHHNVSLLLNESYSSMLKKYVPKLISFREFRSDSEMNYPGSPWKIGSKILENSATPGTEKPLAEYSDAVRVILLEKYGGIWLDADVALLRDFTPLIIPNKQFAYYWQSSYDKNNMNTAVLYCVKKSYVLRQAILRAVNATSFHPKQLSLVNEDIPEQYRIFVFPNPLFDPLWRSGEDEWHPTAYRPPIHWLTHFFEPKLIPDELLYVTDEDKKAFEIDPINITLKYRKVEEFFDGTYAYHWHNHWDNPVTPSSWVGVLETAFDGFLQGARKNLYGEHITDVWPLTDRSQEWSLIEEKDTRKISKQSKLKALNHI